MKFVLLIATMMICTSAHAMDSKKHPRKPSSLPDYTKMISDIECTTGGGKAGDRCQGGKYDGFTVGKCTYKLDGEAYIGKDDGDLSFDGKSFRCVTIHVGDSERDFCRIKNSKSANYDLVVGFDGAENDFFVSSGLDSEHTICHNRATERKR